MSKTLQKGVSAIEVIILILVLAIAAGLVFIYLQQKDSQQQQTAQTQITRPVKTETKPQNNPASLVKSSYEQYQKDVDPETGINQNDPKAALKVFKKNTTSELAQKLDAWQYTVDPVLCAQNSSGQLSFSDPATSGTTATIVVTQTFDGNSSKATVTVDTSTNKITDIMCPKA